LFDSVFVVFFAVKMNYQPYGRYYIRHFSIDLFLVNVMKMLRFYFTCGKKQMFCSAELLVSQTDEGHLSFLLGQHMFYTFL